MSVYAHIGVARKVKRDLTEKGGVGRGYEQLDTPHACARREDMESEAES